ncbi:hypothetical protein DL89DRAFT_271944 [Linderina pennispora]|uniref:BD-FAE-like domain-containing protein n=1 Tax=Linderina pennispora TaxID=61395 RepID=A0A1Y1VUP2_9FUNG|nr:uncharacterized protein DL89DRAFT_271944 [Linderina pennispora]ORX64735.1 hypothetical protein DL89DRAFT_271944 [Linderina pennispora]
MQIHKNTPYAAKHRHPAGPGPVHPGTAAAGTRLPLVIFVHGGGWRAHDKSDFGQSLPGNTVAVAALNYRLNVQDNPSTKHAMHINDLIAGVRFLLTSTYPDYDKFASRLVHSWYEDVTLVVRDMGTHFDKLENPRLWQAIVKHLP